MLHHLIIIIILLINGYGFYEVLHFYARGNLKLSSGWIAI